MSEFDKLEKQLMHLLFIRSRILDELTAMAFVDLGDYIIIQSITDKKGRQKQIMTLHPDINEMNTRGIEVVQIEEGLIIRAPYRMEALEVLWRYFGEGMSEVNEADSISNRIKSEQAKIKAINHRLKSLKIG